MAGKVIRFPGYVTAGPKGYWHGCKHYADFKALVRDLSEGERERTKNWQLRRDGRGNWRAAVLCAYSDEALRA